MTTVECIHGFEPGFCDICFPRERPAAAAAVRTPRATASVRAAAPRTAGATPVARTPRVAGAAAAPRSVPPFGGRRVYHVTHLRNLEAIVGVGAIRSGVTPEVDVSSATTRELRATVEAAPGRMVDSYVPFFLDPLASRWIELRDGAEGAHWSNEARRSRSTEFVTLVTTVAALGTDVVATDGDAAGPLTRVAVGADDAAALVRRLVAAARELLDCEVLAPAEVPLADIVLIGVPNDKVRDRVRAVLRDAGGAQPKVAVYPPWFLRD